MIALVVLDTAPLVGKTNQRTGAAVIVLMADQQVATVLLRLSLVTGVHPPQLHRMRERIIGAAAISKKHRLEHLTDTTLGQDNRFWRSNLGLLFSTLEKCTSIHSPSHLIVV